MLKVVKLCTYVYSLCVHIYLPYTTDGTAVAKTTPSTQLRLLRTTHSISEHIR